ncbi:MAG: nucleoside recognition domain-containing protein [Pseudomonadota bacterium]
MFGNPILRFILPSLVGVLFFLTPIQVDGSTTILIGFLVNTIDDALGRTLDFMVAVLFVTSALLGLVFSLRPHLAQALHPLVDKYFNTTWPWLTFRVVGGVFAMLTALALGPEWINGADTGQVALEIGGFIFVIMLLANFLLPLLVDYGFLEFIGVLLTRIFQRVFKLPGRAGLDAITSWVGDSSVGALLTIRQFDQGVYSAREAAVVVTNFSAVSLPFTVVVIETAKVEVDFLTLYGVVIVVAILAALITPRLPPLSRLPDTYAVASPPGQVQAGGSLPRQAWERGIARAARAPGPREILKRGSEATLDVYFAVLPAAMAIEFLALVAHEKVEIFGRSIFEILSYPMLPLLYLFGVSSPELVLPGTLVGFFDQFVPAIMAGALDDAKARFVLAALSVSQLIFIAENGALILRSNIPLNLGQLFSVFLIRTIIALPILSLAAHLLHP